MIGNQGLKNGDRIKAAVGTAALEALLGYALLAGFWNNSPKSVAEPLKLFDIADEPPLPAASVPVRKRTVKPDGAASPPNLKSRATEIVAPIPPVPLIEPPIIVAPEPARGDDWGSGAADLRGPGAGSGGLGTGAGSGSVGLGEGGGHRKGKPPRKLKGHLKDSDYPRSAAEAAIGGTVSVIFAVETNGRVSECEVTETSGNVALDENTCRLIVHRYRFQPAQDSEGRPVRSRVTESHSWIIKQDPPQESRR